MKPTTAAVVRAVQADLRHGKAAVEQLLAQRGDTRFQDPDIRYVQAAQNTLRTCLEATFAEAGSFTPSLCLELAIRMASYAISAMPLEDQHAAVNAVCRSLPAAHKARLASGIVIRIDWMNDGRVEPNMPEGRA